MDILETLVLEQAKNLPNTDSDNGLLKYEDNMHPEVVRTLLTKYGCDEETIEDVLFELPDTWEYYLNYFEDKYNEK